LSALTHGLRSERARDVAPRIASRARARLSRDTRKRRWAFAAAGGLGCALVLGALWPRRDLPASVAQEIVMRHLGGFARARPCDIESSDPRLVEAWLTDRAGYTVTVRLADDTELLGGRMCQLGGARTAAIMLRRAGKPLTIFVPPPESAAARQAGQLANDGLSCTSGPEGSAICAISAPQPMLAVAEIEPEQVSAALNPHQL
jgi:anti-sigma factor RsiW